MLVGRVFFGSAGVPLMFTQFAFVTDWFIGLNYTFAIGCMYSVSLFSIVIENLLSAHYYDKKEERMQIDF